jgi:ABC-type nitrate/sulfonate/bicarbonate transport system substrate-binding protein
MLRRRGYVVLLSNMVVYMLVLVALAACRRTTESVSPSVDTGTAPQQLVTVRFGMLPYGDHTFAIIGAKKGWFKESGIDLVYTPIKIEEAVPRLRTKALDVVSVPPGILFSGYDSNKDLITFVFSDLFQGYAIMAKGGKYKTYSELTAAGMKPEQALTETVQQLKGRVFTYPPETAIKPFVDLTLRRGGLSTRAVKPLVLDDPLTVNAMRDGRADFQVGGVPSRLVLQREGFVPIVTSADIARTARADAASSELASILQNGWATTKQYYEQHHDTILRLAGVNYRIMQYINDDPAGAAAIHMPYLTQVTGQPFTAADAQTIYTSLDPFYTFERQRSWFHNPADPYFYQHINGAIVNSFVQQGVFTGPPPRVDDVIFADDIYRELEGLRDEARRLIDQAKAANLSTAGDVELKRAQSFFSAFNYLDSRNAARRAVATLVP